VRRMSSFWIYVTGIAVVIVGLALAASQLGVSQVWIAIGAVVLAGIGIVSAVSHTRQKDPPTA
jgi:positive regulator of sigma E activity